MTAIERFTRECERLTGAPIGPDNRLGLAVSGGPDSLAMLLLAHEAFPDAITAITVDHGLREEAANEAEFVADICSDLGVPHHIARGDIEGGYISNIQSRARLTRYFHIAEWQKDNLIPWVATAHHADDQLETVLMRLLRGSGVDGLAAIRPVNGDIIRPLLGFRKNELEEIVAKHQIDPVRDPSNDDEAYDRARLRKALANFQEFDPSRINRSVHALNEASQALSWVERQEARKAIEYDYGNGDFPDYAAPAEVRLLSTGYPDEILRRLVISCIQPYGIEPPRGASLDRLLSSLKAGKKASIGDVLCEPRQRNGKEQWLFSPAPPRKNG